MNIIKKLIIFPKRSISWGDEFCRRPLITFFLGAIIFRIWLEVSNINKTVIIISTVGGLLLFLFRLKDCFFLQILLFFQQKLILNWELSIIFNPPFIQGLIFWFLFLENTTLFMLNNTVFFLFCGITRIKLYFFLELCLCKFFMILTLSLHFSHL